MNHIATRMKININTNAPIVAKQKIKINVPATRVWSLLTEINNWPTWQPSVKEAHLKTLLNEGSEFIWKTGGVTLKSNIHTCEPFNKFGWTDKTKGTYRIHNWEFESVSDGTIVIVEESLQGFFPFIFKRKFRKNLEESMSKTLKDLKEASEK